MVAVLVAVLIIINVHILEAAEAVVELVTATVAGTMELDQLNLHFLDGATTATAVVTLAETVTSLEEEEVESVVVVVTKMALQTQLVQQAVSAVQEEICQDTLELV